MDRNVASVDEGEAPRQRSASVIDVLAPKPRHVHGHLHHDVGAVGGATSRRLETVRRGTGTRCVRPVDYSGVGFAAGAGVRDSPS